MKKLLAMILALGILLSLCACGAQNNAPTDSGATTGEATGTATNETSGSKPTETTQATVGETESTDPEESTGATDPVTTPTTGTQSTPDGCSHEWKDATCSTPKVCTKCGEMGGGSIGHTFTDPSCTGPQTCIRCSMVGNPAISHVWQTASCLAPKTCSVCGATEGSVGEHRYSTDGVCSICGEKKAVYIPLTNGKWKLDALNGQELDRFSLTFNSDGTGYMSVAFWGTQAISGAPFNFNGTTYYDQGFGKGAELTYTENGDTVTVEVSAYGGLNLGNMTLSRTDINKYTVTAVTGTIINDSLTNVVTVGVVFTGIG